MMAKQPNDRPASAELVSQRLRSIFAAPKR
jgi:hypothetical protein